MEESMVLTYIFKLGCNVATGTKSVYTDSDLPELLVYPGQAPPPNSEFHGTPPYSALLFHTGSSGG